MAIISNADLQAYLTENSGCVLVDVREPNEFAHSSLKKSINWPLETVEDRITEYEKQRLIIFVCLSGRRSLQACSFARMIGYKNTYSLEGGLASIEDLN